MRSHLKCILVCFLWAGAGCGDPDINVSHSGKIAQLTWLEGAWQNVEDSVVTTEIWVKQNDSLYTGGSFSVKGTDTIFAEQLSLEARGLELFYVPVVKGQNEDKSVSFRFTSDSAGQFTFENRQHDFPQRIVYTHPSPDSIYAWIEGETGGKNKRVGFPMKRIGK